MSNEANAIIPPMDLSELGEFGLIKLISSVSAKYDNPRNTPWQEVLVGIGDDAAAWQSHDGVQLATTDTLVQGVHFDLDIIGWDELGWKALAVNLSDIAAMGGIPKYALLSLALPSHLAVEDICKFLDSLMHTAEEFAVAVVGGNIAAAPNVIITVTIIGQTKGKAMLRRSTASPGEQIAVTGYVGSSAAGLEMLKRGAILDSETANLLRRAHFRPMPRVREGQVLIDHGITTAIDISDGLVADLDHICQSSKVSAEIKIGQVPVHPAVMANFPNYQDLALHGGEDYELLFAADAATIARTKQTLGCPMTVIGSIKRREELPTRVTLLDNNGNTIQCKRGGWEHFKDDGHQIGFAQP
jgi:thiamine-monophosphate kinase